VSILKYHLIDCYKKEQTVFKIFEYASVVVKFVCHILNVLSQYSFNFGLELEGYYSVKCWLKWPFSLMNVVGVEFLLRNVKL